MTDFDKYFFAAGGALHLLFFAQDVLRDIRLVRWRHEVALGIAVVTFFMYLHVGHVLLTILGVLSYSTLFLRLVTSAPGRRFCDQVRHTWDKCANILHRLLPEPTPPSQAATSNSNAATSRRLPSMRKPSGVGSRRDPANKLKEPIVPLEVVPNDSSTTPSD